MRLWSEGVIAEIPPNMCQKVVENYLKIINDYNAARGVHLNDIHTVNFIPFYEIITQSPHKRIEDIITYSVFFLLKFATMNGQT